MLNSLGGRKIAILATNGVEESELTEPKQGFEAAGAMAFIISPEKEQIKSWSEKNWSNEYKVDIQLNHANPEIYDALYLPGGVMNPDELRTYQSAIDFVNHFIAFHKPIGAICHGPWLLTETSALHGRNITSYYSIKTDLINAGAQWHNKEVIVDDLLITSRSPKDLPVFIKTLIDEIAKQR